MKLLSPRSVLTLFALGCALTAAGGIGAQNLSVTTQTKTQGSTGMGLPMLDGAVSGSANIQTNVDTQAPLPGRNSFTQDQAMTRLREAGYANVTGLSKDPTGVWRANGMRGGKPYALSFDYQGNLNASAR